MERNSEPLLEATPTPSKFHLAALVLALQGFQLFLLMVAVGALTLFEETLRPVLVQNFWIGIAVGAVYLAMIMLITLLKDGLRKSSACGLLYILIILCEAVLLSYLALVYKPVFMFYELVFLTVALFGTALFARCFRTRYRHELGILIGCILVGLGFLAVVFQLPKGDEVTMVSPKQFLFTLPVEVYVWLLINKTGKVAGHAPKKLQRGIYIQLVLCSSKAMWIIKLLTLNFLCCRGCIEEQERMNALRYGPDSGSERSLGVQSLVTRARSVHSHRLV